MQLVGPVRIKPDALTALLRLCRDENAETRYYALYALLDEVTGVDPDRPSQTLTDQGM